MIVRLSEVEAHVPIGTPFDFAQGDNWLVIQLIMKDGNSNIPVFCRDAEQCVSCNVTTIFDILDVDALLCVSTDMYCVYHFLITKLSNLFDFRNFAK
jgi:hypothetical protein